ncbi:hypothetical protein SAMN04488055_5141 [Chitinophaga niabensis]|uniref:Uncharacterized protein n=1 Tax=Chitinophaga niabensis TaxID=536979 RepID=A0A1N6K5U5_9BACT|nr:hypothetical protein SAMN04488055_5141 [Chitinophaga niabensis]
MPLNTGAKAYQSRTNPVSKAYQKRIKSVVTPTHCHFALQIQQKWQHSTHFVGTQAQGSGSFTAAFLSTDQQKFKGWLVTLTSLIFTFTPFRLLEA